MFSDAGGGQSPSEPMGTDEFGVMIPWFDQIDETKLQVLAV
jgi:hypothetical protein